MRTEITLLSAAVQPSGIVEISADWNGTPVNKVWDSDEAMRADVASIISTPEEAARWLMHYITAIGTSAADLPTMVGRKLVHEVSPAIQQTIALV